MDSPDTFIAAAGNLNSLSEQNSTIRTLTVDGGPLSIDEVCQSTASPRSADFAAGPDVPARMARSADLVSDAVRENRCIYGVTTGFGGMANASVDPDQAAASQNNLMSFLAASAGPPIADRHVRAAMLLRANVLSRGASGIRFEVVDRLLAFLRAGASPVVREYGSIGASGDLVPLSTIARAVTGQNDNVRVRIGDRELPGRQALQAIGFEPLELLPKEGLAIVNGTSFSSAIAANVVDECRTQLIVTIAVQAMMLQALLAQHDPFDSFVHETKPHPGQVWVAGVMRELLTDHSEHPQADLDHVQDRYSIRCLPQYTGPAVEALVRIESVIATEMNSVSDNPIIDSETGRFHQSGNFLGQYVGIAMDDLRQQIGLLAKHLDVQIATLVSPEFNHGLPASLQGNSEVPYNMGLKGLQITGNSIMPLLTWSGRSIVDQYPTHAEQFNQNINGLSWSSANLAWKSVLLYRDYLSLSMLFAVQALDLRAAQMFGHYDGRELLGGTLKNCYNAICRSMAVEPDRERPLLRDDGDLWLEEKLQMLAACSTSRGSLTEALRPVSKSLRSSFAE